MNCPHCGGGAIVLETSTECDTVGCPNYWRDDGRNDEVSPEDVERAVGALESRDRQTRGQG